MPAKSCAHVQNEQELISVAIALLGPESTRSLGRLRDAIRAGGDPLGDAFSRIRSPALRRRQGATYTPEPVVRAMVRCAGSFGEPVRIVDPGAGSGRFLIAAARCFPRAHLIAVETDPLAAAILRANCAVLALSRRTTLLVKDYRDVELPAIAGRTLFLGNPPYVRHHDIGSEWKAWFAGAADGLGVRASRLAGLHVHFVVKTMQLARKGDFGTFITSAEWLDVNYGAILRRLLAEGMGGVALHVLDPRAKPFADAATTAAITCFHVASRPERLKVRMVDRTRSLGSLASGTLVPWSKLESSTKWSTIVRPGRAVPAGYVELGEICRVHRGQVTGGNQVWIAGEHARGLPAHVLKPAVTKACDLLAVKGVLKDADQLCCVIDLPADLDELGKAAKEAVLRFLRWARARGVHHSYIARHRQPWWAVNLRPAAPILCTYLARRPPAFVRNLCQARHINIAHGLYPREPLAPHVLDALAIWLSRNVGLESGRTYAGGLTKFEPREVERIRVPKGELVASQGFP